MHLVYKNYILTFLSTYQSKLCNLLLVVVSGPIGFFIKNKKAFQHGDDRQFPPIIQ